VPQIYYAKWFFQIYFILHNNYLKPISELSEGAKMAEKKVPQLMKKSYLELI
jgi:hypothetical protein